MAQAQLNLAGLFGQVVSTLTENKQQLNQADSHNGDHGDNMVEIFSVITEAMESKRDAAPSDQLAYASQLLKQRESGSAQVYSQSLFQAAQDFQGQSVTSGNAIQLVQTLLGGGQPAPKPTASDPVGNLLGGLLGGGQPQQGDDGLDAGDLLNAGLAFLSAKQSGDSNMEAMVDAVVASSNMGTTDHRSQSTALVANTLLQAVSGLGNP